MAQVPYGDLPRGAEAWSLLIPVVILGIVILRNARARTIKVERLWISPAIVMAMTVAAFAANTPPGLYGLMLDVAAVGVGALLGWWRGRASRFTVDPETHVVTSRVSPAGMLLILGIFGVRYVLRGALGGESSALHLTASEVTDSFLLLAVGVVSAQRLEWWIRARKMIAEARAA
jgi:hypothetical protein